MKESRHANFGAIQAIFLQLSWSQHKLAHSCQGRGQRSNGAINRNKHLFRSFCRGISNLVTPSLTVPELLRSNANICIPTQIVFVRTQIVFVRTQMFCVPTQMFCVRTKTSAFERKYLRLVSKHLCLLPLMLHVIMATQREDIINVYFGMGLK